MKPRFPVDLSLFDVPQHSPSFFSLCRSMGLPGVELRDYCIPVNPYFPPPGLLDVLHGELDRALKYYPSQNEAVAEALSQTLDLDPATLVVANGSTELITWIDWLLVRESLAVPVPTFGRWTDQPEETGKRVETFLRRPEDDFALPVDEFVAFCRARGVGAAALCNPNNPTGALLRPREALRLADALGDLDVVVIDESFIDFAQEQEVPSIARHAAARDNLIVLKSLGKNFGLHGVRMGYAVTNRHMAARLRKALPRWNLNGLAELLIGHLPGYLPAYEESRRRVVRDRVRLSGQLAQLPGLTVYPSSANFVYFELDPARDGIALRNQLLVDHGCFVRECGNKLGASSQHFRVAARPPADADYLIGALDEILRTGRAPVGGYAPRAAAGAGAGTPRAAVTCGPR